MRVLVATALALLAMVMMSRSCVADPDPDQAPEATIDPPFPEPENKIPVELEDNGDFDLANIHYENELIDQLTKMDAEDSSTIEPADFVGSCSGTGKSSSCRAPVMFTVMGVTYDMNVTVNILYDKSKNLVRFQLIVNNRCLGKKFLSGADGYIQSMFGTYYLKGVTFTISLQTHVMYANMAGGRIITCSRVKIMASNKTWAVAYLGCVSLK